MRASAAPVFQEKGELGNYRPFISMSAICKIKDTTEENICKKHVQRSIILCNLLVGNQQG